MKKIYLFAVAALALAACSNESDFQQEAKTVEAPQAIAFDTYTANTTRAGKAGVMTTATLQAADGGFGVFAYQTNGAYPDGGTGKKPNFMYNEAVKYASSVWSYGTLKYWPNNTTQDMLGVVGHASTTTPNDYVSFFAYAPYVSNGTGGEPGITAMSANSATGDPTISYQIATTPSQSVDLLWAVTPTDWTYDNVAGTTWNSGSEHNGKPLIDLLKPDVQTRVKFMFLHALARLGINVVAAVDQAAAGGELNTAQTKIVIESVTITESTGTKNLAASGVLNLNNTTAGVANWTPDAISSPFTVTVNSSNGLDNSLLWESDAATSFLKDGVLTAKEKPLIANDKYFMLIPTTAAINTDLDVNIVYHVITKDTKLDGSYSNVVNNITKKVSIDFDNGKAYTLKLILGLTSVKLDAEVKTWDIQGAKDVDLPQNEE
jgi:hypothetical protein